jgi:hypothetical protein
MDKLYNLTQPLLVKIPLVFSSRGAVVAAFFLIVFAKTVQVQLQYILTPKTGYNNVNPREARGDENSWQVQAIQRARNSQDNSWEAFIMFTAAMLLALTSKTYGALGLNREPYPQATQVVSMRSGSMSILLHVFVCLCLCV